MHNPDSGDKTMANTVTSTVTGNNCQPASGDSACTAMVTVLTPALSITKTADAATAVPGATLNYTITVTNSGQIAYTGATFTDDLDEVLDEAGYNGDAAATAGSVTFTTPNLAWTGNLAVGAAATITYSVTVHNPETGDLTLDNTVTSTTAGSNCAAGSTDPRCSATVEVVNATTLTFTKTADVASTTAGGVVNYTITAANYGLTPYVDATFTDPLTGVLDDAVYNNDENATAGTVSFGDPDLTWTGTVPASGSVTITYSVTVNDSDSGDKILTNTLGSISPLSNCGTGSTDLRCTATVTVSQLTIANTYPATTTPGSVIGFTTTFTNTGQTPYYGITISVDGSDLIDDAIVNGDQTVSSGSLIDTGTGAAWTGDVPVGGTVTITASFTVRNPDPGNKVITSTWSTGAPGSNCPPGSVDPGCTITTDVLIPALSITKAADATFALPGQTVNYTITVTNGGQTPYPGATVTDPLTGILLNAEYDNDATATAGTVSFARPDLTWTGNLAVGASAIITYSVTVHNPPTDGKILSNSVYSTDTGSTCAPASPDPGCTVTMPVLTPLLSISKTADASTTTPGLTVHYTITVDNTGQTAYTGATVTDPLAGVLDDAAYNGDASATSGSVTYASPNLAWTGDLGIGDTATITYSATVNDPDGGNHVLANTVSSSASGSGCPVGNTSTNCTATVNVSALTISNTADVATTTPGSDVHYTFTVTNSGQVPYLDATVTAHFAGVLDDATYNGDVSATSGNVTINPVAYAATWTGDLAPGATVTITGSFTVNDPATGNKILTEYADSATPGSNCPVGGTDPACAATVTVLVPALTITKTADATAVAPGATVNYTITVDNTGDTPYSGATVTDDLDEVLDEAAYNDDATATAGSVSYTSPTLAWTGDLAAGASATITYSVTVSNPATGGKHLSNTATSADTGSTCPPDSPGSACTSVVTVLTPALTIVKSADVSTTTPGSAVNFTITVSNTGQVPYTGATFTDDLTGALDDAAYNGDATATAGSLAFTSPDITWTGDLAIGTSATITYSLTVNNPDTGDAILANTVSSTTTGSNCGAGSTDARCTATVEVAALTISNTADVATTTPGSEVRYTFTVTNSGQVPYLDANLTAHFAGVLDDATYNGDVSATSGNVTIKPAAHAATWTGDLAVGATVTITGSFTVNDPATGNKILTENADSTTPGNNCPVGGTDPACVSTVTVLVPGLTLTKTADASTTTPGSAVTYTITVDNTGQTDYTGATVTDDLTGVLNDAAYNTDASADTGAVSYSSPALTWTGDLAVGDTATITYSVTVNDPDTGDKLLVNTVSSTDAGSTCPPGGTGAACTVSVRDLIPALSITKTADVTSLSPGEVVGYTIVIADTGETPYTGATVTDDLSEVLDEAAYDNDATATAGSATFASQELTWTGDLTIGDSVTVTYSVTVHNPITGDLDLDNTVTSAAPGNNCPDASTDPACAADVFVIRGPLSIAVPASADLGAAVPGGTTSASLGPVQVTDERALAATTWTATVSGSDFVTGGGTPAETIPVGHAGYFINTLSGTTGSATFGITAVTQLSAMPQAVVTATNANGDTSASWDPAVQVAVPSAAVGGVYTATITHSVS